MCIYMCIPLEGGPRNRNEIGRLELAVGRQFLQIGHVDLYHALQRRAEPTNLLMLKYTRQIYVSFCGNEM